MTSAVTKQPPQAGRIVIAGESMGLDEAVQCLERYPLRTPMTYDYPGPGHPFQISLGEIARTRAISSRISAVEGEWFIALSITAPWTPVSGDLQDADPAEVGGFYDSMLRLYGHFAGAAPKGVGIAKISKVLHLKRPTQFPILDSRLVRTYAKAATRAAAIYASRGNRRMYWAAIRLDLERSADGLTELRNRMAIHSAARVQAMRAVSDLRLLDMLTW
ncbi:DUF6308 family protein [Mycolicibacterium sp. XJ879]